MIRLIIDIINKKREKKELTKEELEMAFMEYLKGKIADYQMSALLMAICCNGMSEQETFDLVDIFIHGGKILDFSDLHLTLVDKHSTGGVGDKTTLILGPILASCKVPMVKICGRGLGYTGGTIDKLESIPSFQVSLNEEEIKGQLQKIGLVITSQTKDLVPLDQKIYALRDVTGTTNSIPLIASSIMSKKIVCGADKIIIDIKIGSGALIKTQEEAKQLSSLMIKIGKKYHKEVKTVFSDMDHPLGRAIGNKLEVMEAVNVLQGKEEGELYDLCIELSSQLISMAKKESLQTAERMAKEAITSGRAYQKFKEWIKTQHGKLEELKISAEQYTIKAPKKGIIKKIDALAVGKLSLALGAGRKEKNDTIDYNAGVVLVKMIGDAVKEGEVLAFLYTNRDISHLSFENIFQIE